MASAVAVEVWVVGGAVPGEVVLRREKRVARAVVWDSEGAGRRGRMEDSVVVGWVAGEVSRAGALVLVGEEDGVDWAEEDTGDCRVGGTGCFSCWERTDGGSGISSSWAYGCSAEWSADRESMLSLGVGIISARISSSSKSASSSSSSISI